MIKFLYPFLSGALALQITNATYADIHAYPIIMPLSPYVYRVLLVNIWTLLDETIGPYLASWLIWFVCFSFLAFLVDEIGQRITAESKNVQLFLLATLVVTPSIVLLQPGGALWNAIEAVFFAAAILMILDGRTWSLYPLLFVATLNRETAVLIALMFFFVTRNWKHTAGLFVVWATTYGGLRLIIGPVPSHLTLAFILDINLGAGLLRSILGLPLVIWLFWYAWKGWKVAPEPIRWATYIVPVYLAMVAVFGIWHEWRLILTLYPLLIPLAGVSVGVGNT